MMLSLLCNRVFGRLARLPRFAPQSLRLFSTSRVNLLTKEGYRNWYQRKRREDPKWHEKRRAQNRELTRRIRAQDPETVQEWHRLQREKHAAKEDKSRLLYTWCTKKAWVRSLPWKTHTPISYTQSIELYCTSCDHTRINGSRLFWSAHDSGHYVCNGCYTGKSWADIMPANYEDCRSLRDIAARKQELDGINPLKLP